MGRAASRANLRLAIGDLRFGENDEWRMTNGEWAERMANFFTIMFPGHMARGGDVVEMESSLT
jgi:hypothetical protein